MEFNIEYGGILNYKNSIQFSMTELYKLELPTAAPVQIWTAYHRAGSNLNCLPPRRFKFELPTTAPVQILTAYHRAGSNLHHWFKSPSLIFSFKSVD